MKNILVVFTGGTIGSVATGGTINTEGSTSFQLIRLFEQHYENHRQIHFDTIQPLQILSENLAPAAWNTLIQAIETARPDQYDGIIVTHGTDTLAYTACALSFYFNAIDIPMLLVSSDYPLAHAKANGLENFICAVEFILQRNETGVFVPYRNQQQTAQLHRGSRLTCSLQLSGDFFSVQDKSYMRFENRQFSLPNPPEQQTPARHVPLKADFSARILMIKPYPGLDYGSFNLNNADAVLHDLYHSGTACASLQWGENYSLLEFIKRCKQQGISVYLAPALKSADAYQSTQALIEQGAKIIWNMSIEAAYVKLLLAYGNCDHRQEIMDFIDADVAGEHL
ncbi:asparaginase [Candidatus Methylobacter oryzae]|uniref:Asparaginase n=1 Tax=Candidatus Methylobacter oryzae TaxID=2497749 RepID=A0ABY3CAQ8_9GAMM|nr:asparaginase domain-containing protein [Candidatus Methylobacter oryzae]TRW95557.1 asparaginase [Candidatus Methylobacter oryzae]